MVVNCDQGWMHTPSNVDDLVKSQNATMWLSKIEEVIKRGYPVKIDDSLQYALVPMAAIDQRISRLQQRLAAQGMDSALIMDSLNMYYYTGTLQQA